MSRPASSTSSRVAIDAVGRQPLGGHRHVGVGRGRDHDDPVAPPAVPVEPAPHLGPDVGGEVADGELARPPGRGGRRRPRPATRVNSSSLVSSATVPPATAAWASRGASSARGPQHGAAAGHGGQEVEHAPAVGQGAVEVEGGDVGHVRAGSGAGAGDGRRRPGRHRRRTGRRPRAPRPRRGCPGRAGSRRRSASATGRSHWSSGRAPVVAQADLGEGGELARPRPRPPRAPSPAAPPGWPGPWPAPRRRRRPGRSGSGPGPGPRPTRRGSRTVPPSTRGTPKRRQKTPKAASVGGHPQVAPHGQLEPAGHGVALDGGDHRLGQGQPGRAHRARARPRPPGCRSRRRWPGGRRRRRRSRRRR